MHRVKFQTAKVVNEQIDRDEIPAVSYNATSQTVMAVVSVSKQTHYFHRCHVKVRSVNTDLPLQQVTPTFWRKDKRSKNVAMIEQFLLRDTHLPPGETRGRGFGMAAWPIVSQQELKLKSIGVPATRGVDRQRMMLTDAKEDTLILRAFGESHWRMFRHSFPG